MRFTQLVRKTRSPNLRVYNRSPKMKSCPQRSGICLKVMTAKPKKPNSAIRKLAKIALSDGNKIRAVIPGSGHQLKEFNSVMFQAGRVRDIPGVHYKLIRGKGDLDIPNGFTRHNRRSKFSIPNWTVMLLDKKNTKRFLFIGSKLRSTRHQLEHEYGLPKTWNTNKYYVSRAVRKRTVR